MKILHVITSLGIGGAEKLMVDLLPRLRAMGNEVELLIFDGSRTPFLDRLEGMGITVHRLHERGGVYSPGNVLRLLRFVRRYDVIHTHNTACQLYVPLARTLALGGARLVTTEHNTTNRRRDLWYFKPIDRWMYGRYSKIISISEKATAMLRDYINPRNLVTVENGIDLDAFINATPADRSTMVPGYAEGNVIVTMVAGFREQKDQDTAIRAIGRLPEHYKLCLVGDGERRGALEALVAELGLQGRVRLLGIRSDVPQLLHASDINLLSSHWEGLSLSSVEGMASGKPFMASDVNGLREVVGKGGVLFAEGNDGQLAREIERLATDSEEYKRVSAACMAAARAYDVSLTAARYNEIYKEICQKN